MKKFAVEFKDEQFTDFQRAKFQTEENQISILKKIEELEKLEREDRKILDALQKDLRSSLQKDSKTVKEE